MDYEDRVRGMFAGFFIGDQNGAPYEFYKWNHDRIYTDKITLEPYRKTMYGQEKRAPLGSVTDDTQMTIALLKMLLDNNMKYDREEAIIAYGRWVNSKPHDIGINTKFVFANKTIKGYESRIKKRDEEIAAGTRNISLSNGSLMRCSPFILLDDDEWLSAAKEDVKLSNPYQETIEVNVIYLCVLRRLLNGKSLDSVKRFIFRQKPKSKAVINVIDDLKNNVARDIGGRDKGLAVHALYCSLKGLLMDASFTKTIRWVITQGGDFGVGDTDTNAAICGGLLGARYGWDKIMKSKITRYNWDILINAANNVTGPIKYYVPHDFDDLMIQIFDR
uniref:ADP-ribosylglycohydrolase n=1 Tax=viral metagenome TaxID=1070528 RepID=A0A6C0CB47_9ZZZZ